MQARRVGWGLAGMGGLAAIATLAGPADRLLGIDLGATGSVVFWLSAAAGAWLLAKRSDEIFADDMSVTERRAWISAGFLMLIVANFVLGMIAIAEHPVPHRISDISFRFPLRVGFLLAAWLTCISVIGDEDDADERDTQLQHRAGRIADGVFFSMVLLAVFVLLGAPVGSLSWWLAPLVLAHVIIGVLLVRALVEHVVLALSYRRA